MGNGFPMAALVTTPEIANLMGEAAYFNTFSGNPLACAVGSTVLDVIKN
jgi:alanine-glyoxylate transaminase / (R)-3-amino-2-methylpropionate-pyruvate transaminase